MNVFTASEVPQGRHFINRRFQPTDSGCESNPASRRDAILVESNDNGVNPASRRDAIYLPMVVAYLRHANFYPLLPFSTNMPSLTGWGRTCLPSFSFLNIDSFICVNHDNLRHLRAFKP
jgi:hypothetical protein